MLPYCVILTDLADPQGREGVYFFATLDEADREAEAMARHRYDGRISVQICMVLRENVYERGVAVPAE